MSRLVPGGLRLVAVTLIGALGVALFGSSAAATPSARAAQPVVVIVAVPDLLWSDVAVMPHLDAVASRGAVGELVVKTAGGVTRCPAGLLAVSAGNRTEAPAPAGARCAIAAASWPALTQANRRSRYRARLGVLGTTLQAGGVPTVAVGATAAAMLADAAGTVTATVRSLPQALRVGGVIGVVDPGLYDATSQQRAAARRQVDAHLASIVASLPAGATVLIAGVSDAGTGSAALHAVVVAGPGWRHTEMHSSAAGRAPYVQLIDLAPTVLTIERLAVPPTVAGRPMLQSARHVPPISAFIEDNRHAVREGTLGQLTFLIVGILAIMVMCLASLPLTLARRAGGWLARLVAPAPVMMFVANAVPWWRWGNWSYGVVMAAGCIALAVLTTLVMQSRPWAGLIAVPACSFLALVLDQLSGAHLQLSAPLGDNPLVAGRFRGMGNIDFAVMATSGLLVAGVVGGRVRRAAGLAVAGGIVLVALVVDGAPRLGDDLGGVLSLVPAALVLLALLAQVRLTWVRVVGVVVATAVVALGVALADYSRPASSQTHVGRFVGQVLHGGAGTEVRRKLDAVVGSFGGTVGTVLFIVAVVLAVAHHRRLRAAATAAPGVTASTAAIVILAIVATVLNDSGVTIAAMVIVVGFMTVYGAGWSAVRAAAGDAGHGD